MTVPFFPPPALMDATAVGVGAVCGAMCRHQVGRAAAEQIAKDPKRLGHLTGEYILAGYSATHPSPALGKSFAQISLSVFYSCMKIELTGSTLMTKWLFLICRLAHSGHQRHG